MKCKRNGNLYIDVPIENIYYEGHIIKYLDDNYNIDKFQKGHFYSETWKRLVGLFWNVFLKFLQEDTCRMFCINWIIFYPKREVIYCIIL